MDWTEAKIIYQTSSKGEFISLEKAMKSFSESYFIKSGKIIVKKGIDDWIDISPERGGKIEEVSAVKEPLEGYTRKSSSEFLTLRIENREYRINFNPGK